MTQRLEIFCTLHQENTYKIKIVDAVFKMLPNLLWNLFEKIIKLMKWLMILISLFLQITAGTLHLRKTSAILLKIIWKIYAMGKKFHWKVESSSVCVCCAPRCVPSVSKKFVLILDAERLAVSHRRLSAVFVQFKAFFFFHLDGKVKLSQVNENRFAVFQSAKDEEEILKKLWRKHENPVNDFKTLFFCEIL